MCSACAGDYENPEMTARDIQIVCPQCGATVTAPVGDAQCLRCWYEFDLGDATGDRESAETAGLDPGNAVKETVVKRGPGRATGFEASLERLTAVLGQLERLATVEEQVLRESARVTRQAAAALGMLAMAVRAKAGREE